MSKKTLKIVAGCAFALLAFGAVAEMPRSEWHGLVSECAQNPAALKSTIVQLTAADQKAFVSEVNEAISKMPGSNEKKAAAYVEAARAAVEGSSDVNAVIAEIFATIPTEYLTDVNERLASDVFSRNQEGAQGVTDEQFQAIAEAAVKAVAERAGESDDGAVRSTFAILSFVRASGGTPEGLTDKLVTILPENYQETAGEVWIPAALGVDQTQTYDPMLGVARAGTEPNHTYVSKMVPIVTSGRSVLASMASSEASSSATDVLDGFYQGVGFDPLAREEDISTDVNQVPRELISDKDSEWYSRKRGQRGGGTYGGQRTN